MAGLSWAGANGWVLGAAGADTFPTNGRGGGTATAADGILHNCKEVEILGILISTAAAGLASACDSGGTAIPGLTVDANSTGWKPFGTGANYIHASNANIGIKLPAVAVGTLFYVKIR